MIYSTLLAVGQIAGAGDVVIYTAPEVNVVVVRDVVLGTLSSTATFVQLYTTEPGPGARGEIYDIPAPAARTTYQWTGRQVLSPGSTLTLHSDTGVVRYRVSGYVLT